MIEKTMKILIPVLVILCLFLLFKSEENNNYQSYGEVTYSIYKISNQCIANYYYNNLTEEGMVFSTYAIIPECNAVHLNYATLKIYDTDEEQQSNVKSYILHGIMIKLGGNAIFMERVLLRRLDNNEIIKDITEQMREDNDYIQEDDENTSI